MEAAQVELIAHLQRNQQVLLHIGGILVVLDLPDLALHRVDTGAAVFRVEGLGADGEEGGIECQRLMDLEPGNAKRHHHIGHGVGLGEEIADLRQRLNVPIGHMVLAHGLLPAVLEAALFHLALTHRLHDLKGHLRLKTHLDQVEHDIVAAAHRLQNTGRAADDQLTGVAQPHIRTVGKAGQTHQRIEILGLGVHEHTAGKAGVELRDGHCAGGTQYLIVFIAQHLG